MRTILVTGTAGFIGFHLARLLLEEGFAVAGVDLMTDYYDVGLKEARRDLLRGHAGFRNAVLDIRDADALSAFAAEAKPSAIVHLAAQAGVRYSLEQPRTYVDTNVTGTFNVLECARALGVDHLLIASTSSVYGANTRMPFRETDPTDHPLTIYAATKKAAEVMAHSYASLWQLPTTLFRFFTVYGPWGRPDMAPFKFAKGIAEGTPIDLYNHGEMYRDFTYVDDLVKAVRLLVDVTPPPVSARGEPIAGDSLSPVAPFRVVNIGNSQKVRLLDFIEEIERCLGKRAVRNLVGMQQGDVPATWADASLLEALTGYRPRTGVAEGVRSFVDWYRDYHAV